MIHKLGFVHGALKRRKIRIDDTEEVWFTDLSRVRQGKRQSKRQGMEAGEEFRKLRRWLKYPKKDNPSPLHPVELGHIPFAFDNPNAAFCTITTWMEQESWFGSMKDDMFGDTWLEAKFSSAEHVKEFIAGWYSSRRPAEFHDIRCADTRFNQESQGSSRAYSQALSPSPGPDVDSSVLLW
ncbi:hypothetical protein APHAL10511_005141 [Amanita phalloides]|nr:hypothetical protein APHAL10511_005141 [Amanita phalloides]